jgi:hypothetical protein
MAETKKTIQEESTPASSTKAVAAANGGTNQPGSVTPGSHPVPVPAPPLDTGNTESVTPGSHPVPGTDDKENSQAAVAK